MPSCLFENLADRLLLFSATIHAIHAIYAFSAVNILPKLPLQRSVFILLIVIMINETVGLFNLLLNEEVEDHFNSSFIWAAVMLLQLAVILFSIFGLKNAWLKLSMEAGWRKSVTITLGLMIGVLIGIDFVQNQFTWTSTQI